MEEKGLFKTAVFGGFERQSVLTYIKNLTDRSEQKEKELTQELWESTQRSDELLNLTKELREKLAQLEQDYQQEKQRANRLDADFAHLMGEMKKQQELMESQNNELLIQNERVRQLQKRNEMLELKSKKYDESTMQLGCLMLDAQKKADALLREAQQQADEIRGGAQQSVDDAKAEAEAIIADAKKTAQETLRGLGIVQASYGEFKRRIMDSLKGVVKLMDEADNAFDKCKIDAAQEEVLGQTTPVPQSEQATAPD